MMVPTTRSVLLTPNADDNVCACTSRPRGPFYWPIARPDGPEPSRWLRILPSRASSSNTSTARGESLVMAHDELRLYLVDRVESQLIMRHYEGFTPRSGRIRGRRATW